MSLGAVIAQHPHLVLGRGGFGFAQVWQEHGRTAATVQFSQILHDRVQCLLLICATTFKSLVTHSERKDLKKNEETFHPPANSISHSVVHKEYEKDSSY